MTRAGRPIRRWSDDEYLDFLVNEALATKDAMEQKEAQEKQKDDTAREDFRKSHKGMSLEDLEREAALNAGKVN